MRGSQTRPGDLFELAGRSSYMVLVVPVFDSSPLVAGLSQHLQLALVRLLGMV